MAPNVQYHDIRHYILGDGRDVLEIPVTVGGFNSNSEVNAGVYVPKQVPGKTEADLETVALSVKGKDNSNEGYHLTIQTDSQLKGVLVKSAGPIKIPCQVPLYHRPWKVEETLVGDAVDSNEMVVGIFGALFSLGFWLPVLNQVATSALSVILTAIFSPSKPQIPRLIATFSPPHDKYELMGDPLPLPTRTLPASVSTSWWSSNMKNGWWLYDVWRYPTAYCVATSLVGGTLFNVIEAEFWIVNSMYTFRFKLKPFQDLAIRSVGITLCSFKAKWEPSPDKRNWTCNRAAFNCRVLQSGVNTEFSETHPALLRSGIEYFLQYSIYPDEEQMKYTDTSNAAVMMDTTVSFLHDIACPGIDTNVR